MVPNMGTLEDRGFRSIDEFFVTNNDIFLENTAGHFKIPKPNFKKITKEHKCAVEMLYMTDGFFNLQRHSGVHVYITEDKKTYKLIGVGDVSPCHVHTVEELCRLINNEIIAVFVNYYKHVHFHDMIKELGTQGYADVTFHWDKRMEELKVFLPKFKYHGKFLTPHIVLGGDLQDLTGFKSYHPQSRDHKPLPYINVCSPNLRYQFHHLKLMCNFTDKPLYGFNFLGDPWGIHSYDMPLIDVITPDVEDLEFWFENEEGERIRNETGRTVLHLRFIRE